jgi:hypothetical protein
MRHRGVSVPACLEFIGWLDNFPEPEGELLGWWVDKAIGDAAHWYTEHRRRVRAAAFEVYDPPAEVRADGAVVDARGNVWVKSRLDPPATS